MTTTKWYVSEEDMGHLGHPLSNVCADTKLYDTKEEAEEYADELSGRAKICFCAWPHEVTI